MPEINTNTKMPPGQMDPAQLARQLELELMMKRVEWKKTKAKQRSFRTASFAFLFILIAGCAAAFLFLFSRVTEERGSHSSIPASSIPGR